MKRRYSSTVVGFPIPQHLRLMKHKQLSRKSLTGAHAQVRATGNKLISLNCEICPFSSACALGDKFAKCKRFEDYGQVEIPKIDTRQLSLF